MNKRMRTLKCLLYVAFPALLLFTFSCTSKQTQTVGIEEEEIDRAWKNGTTLPQSIFDWYPLPLQKVKGDKGINVMVDLVHQCKFNTMWTLPSRLNALGHRAIGNQASLHSVLDPEGLSRVRFHWNDSLKIYPFAWHPNFEYNVIISHQSDHRAQEYLPEEQEALLQFVENGGGLVLYGVAPPNDSIAGAWSFNHLCKKFDAELTANTDVYNAKKYSIIQTGLDWEVLNRGENGNAVSVFRKYGNGYVAIFGHDEMISVRRKDKEEIQKQDTPLNNILEQLAKGKEPVGGEPRYPISGGGGGGIYPEIEKNFGDVVLFYAANQKKELLKTVEEDLPVAKKLVEGWLPSKPTQEPMYLILSSGGGGGWAVNAFKPKENGIISLSPMGILSIFAHELAHTMHGPVNNEGEVAGITPIPNRGEAHAGWFQGKVDAWFQDELKDKAVKKCNSLYTFDPNANALDLVTHYENDALRKEYGKGKDWVKTWWIWQKLDDRYGPTWYPRWKYIQHTRWAKTPKHRLTWDEMAEDMSIAVGEDLFPFLNKAGLSLNKKTMGKVIFDGQEIALDKAPIDTGKAGKVQLQQIEDYKQTIN